MSSKPERMVEVALVNIDKGTNTFTMWSNTARADDLKQFGSVVSLADNHYHVMVDSRYDFEEVQAYALREEDEVYD
jgi:hypothetical protein